MLINQAPIYRAPSLWMSPTNYLLALTHEKTWSLNLYVSSSFESVLVEPNNEIGRVLLRFKVNSKTDWLLFLPLAFLEKISTTPVSTWLERTNSVGLSSFLIVSLVYGSIFLCKSFKNLNLSFVWFLSIDFHGFLNWFLLFSLLQDFYSPKFLLLLFKPLRKVFREKALFY